MITQDARATARAAALEHIRRANLREPVATITAGKGRDTWQVRITRRSGEFFEVCGRATRMDVYLAETNDGYLVSVPNFHRCGLVPADCNTYDIMEYVRIENKVDATTLAAAVRYLIGGGNDVQ
jgi:hypothetical protein